MIESISLSKTATYGDQHEVLGPLRACSRSSEQKSQEGEMDELQAGVEFSLAVFP